MTALDTPERRRDYVRETKAALQNDETLDRRETRVESRRLGAMAPIENG
jgi:hypothetical protein